MLTKDQREIATRQLIRTLGWSEEQAQAKLDEFLAIKAAIDFAGEHVSIDEVRARMQREGLMQPYRNPY